MEGGRTCPRGSSRRPELLVVVSFRETHLPFKVEKRPALADPDQLLQGLVDERLLRPGTAHAKGLSQEPLVQHDVRPHCGLRMCMTIHLGRCRPAASAGQPNRRPLDSLVALVHLSHPTGAERGDDLVGTQACPGRESHVNSEVTNHKSQVANYFLPAGTRRTRSSNHPSTTESDLGAAPSSRVRIMTNRWPSGATS